jgi:hypothetical protein
MARGNPIILATQSFATQAAANAHFSAMLNRYKPGDKISDEDAADLHCLLERHPRCAEKIGCGLSHFELMATGHGSNCFRVVRTDGSGTDFSIKTCITGRASPMKEMVNRALRDAVKIDIYEVRRKYTLALADENGLIECAITKQRVHPKDTHIDHRAPMTFDVIVTTFLQKEGLTYEGVPIETGQDDQTVPVVTDPALAQRFRDWHTKLATIDFVSAKANLQVGPSNRIKKTRVSLK